MYMKLSDIAILNFKGSDYCCIIDLISKNEATNLVSLATRVLKTLHLYVYFYQK